MNQPVISFFYDAQKPLIEPECEPDDLITSLVEGVDMGLSTALAEYAEGWVEYHERLAVRAFRTDDEATGDFHAERARYWADFRKEALATHRQIIRVRAN